MSKRCIRPRKKLKDPFLEATVLNNYTYQNYYLRLAQIALSMFEWENLPDTMNGQFLEWCLFKDGQAALLYDNKYGFINTRSVIKGKLNIYALPVSIECYSYEYHETREVYDGLETKTDKNKQAILVENMVERTPTLPTLELFAMRLTEAQRSEDVNIKNQKFPFFISTDERQRMTVLNAYQQIDGNSPIVIGDNNGIDLNSIKAMETQAPYVADKIQLYRRKLWQEALEFLGVNSVVDNKKERLVSDEANANNEVINLNLQAFLVPRQRACRYFNQKYGMDIKVKVRSDLQNLIKQNESVVTEMISNPGADDE